MALVEAHNLIKNYRSGGNMVTAIQGADFTINPGSIVSVVGPLGSGKSTLINMIGCLDSPTGGSLNIDGQDVMRFDATQTAKFRSDNIGFIFQDFNLIPMLTVFENIEYPLQMVQNWPDAKGKKRVEKLMEIVGIAGLGDKYPSQISDGRKQQVAVARALATDARLVLADEPTANLDNETANGIIALMKKMRDELGTTFIFSTHDLSVGENAEIVFNLEGGLLLQQEGDHEWHQAQYLQNFPSKLSAL